LLNEELLFLGFLHYDLRDLRLVPFFQRRDHGEPRYEHLLLHRAVDGDRLVVQPHDGGSNEHFRVHYDHPVGDDAVQNEDDESVRLVYLDLCGIQRLPSFLVVA
jgi:hypothetical protein